MLSLSRSSGTAHAAEGRRIEPAAREVVDRRAFPRSGPVDFAPAPLIVALVPRVLRFEEQLRASASRCSSADQRALGILAIGQADQIHLVLEVAVLRRG